MNEQDKGGSRESLLQKFNSVDRFQISAAEIKFLADSSELLYGCINRKHAQEMVATLDQGLISSVQIIWAKDNIYRHS
jgi:hypothetical protein